jgi:hypothetical protein
VDVSPVEYDKMFRNADIDGESLTVILVAGGTRADVLRVLGADPVSNGEPYPDEGDDDHSAYAACEVQGGVFAMEHSGYADPSPSVLAALSELGGAAAVTRSNIQAHERFGCARDGVVLFDDNEFKYVEADEREAVPAELRELFDSAWVDLDADDDVYQPVEGFVGYAMAAVHTGVVVTGDDLKRAAEGGYHRVRMLTYLE